MVVETAENLRDDIAARLPGSTLAGLADELIGLAVQGRGGTVDEQGRAALQSAAEQVTNSAASKAMPSRSFLERANS
jgi:hypothetical protein